MLLKMINDVTGANAFHLFVKHDFVAFKTELGKLDINKLINVLTSLDN